MADLSDLRENWVHNKGEPHMHAGVNPLTNELQSFYFPNDHPTMPGWFKRMEEIIHKHGLWPEDGLPTEYPGFKCPVPEATDGEASCCYQRVLFNQDDFILQKPQLQELIKSHKHLCDFYPKYHCELNFIEQYWGVANLCFCVAGRATTLNQMER
jgi:hypothetical protein